MFFKPLSMIFVFGIVLGNKGPKRVAVICFTKVSEFVNNDVVNNLW
ncbi:hypothetical protein SAMN06266787_1069 [Halorubrum ezzemoulense]|uniref:Uncharacterized protein n=1 Tax=Halorubrum ezzemoulense TaxID=337243 RepID=A0A238XNB5_HALEZ|nr:hypothetical protein SAMN06266787_1069 [Halorubrum ezzemoulense]